jgi:cystathionine beta-synthase
MERAFGDPGVLDRPVEDVMGPALPTVGVGQAVELAVEMLDSAPALLVLDGGRPRTVLSRADVLTYLSPDHATPGPEATP